MAVVHFARPIANGVGPARIACGDPGQYQRDLPPEWSSEIRRITCPLCLRSMGAKGEVDHWRRVLTNNRRNPIV